MSLLQMVRNVKNLCQNGQHSPGALPRAISNSKYALSGKIDKATLGTNSKEMLGKAPDHHLEGFGAI